MFVRVQIPRRGLICLKIRRVLALAKQNESLLHALLIPVNLTKYIRYEKDKQNPTIHAGSRAGFVC